jgi:hypothetical protein
MYMDGRLISVSLATVAMIIRGSETELRITEQGVFFDGQDGNERRREGTEYLCGRSSWCRGSAGSINVSDQIREATVCLWYNHDAEHPAKFYAPALVGNGGQQRRCGRYEDQRGLSRQMAPKALTATRAKGGDASKPAFAATMTMKKIDIEAIQAAVQAHA